MALLPHGGHQLIAYITNLVQFLDTSQLNSVIEKPSGHCKELVSVPHRRLQSIILIVVAIDISYDTLLFLTLTLHAILQI
jgi:hypothetical protein